MSDVTTLRAQLWSASNRNLYAITLAAHAVGADIPCHDAQQLQEMIQHLTRNRHAVDQPVYKLQPLPQIAPQVHDWKARYQQAHRLYYETEFPNVVKDGFYIPPVLPKVHTSGGLQKFIVTYLDWTGCYGNRINTTGRKIFDKKKGKEIWITGTTKKGSGDTVACCRGKMIWFEVKVGADTPSDKQIEQQRKITRSGGKYYFVKTPDDFLTLYDAEMYG